MGLPVSIISISSFSPLGDNNDAVWNSYLDNNTLISPITRNDKSFLAAELPEDLNKQAELLKTSDARYRHLDKSVLYAILAARWCGWAIPATQDRT